MQVCFCSSDTWKKVVLPAVSSSYIFPCEGWGPGGWIWGRCFSEVARYRRPCSPPVVLAPKLGTPCCLIAGTSSLTQAARGAMAACTHRTRLFCMSVWKISHFLLFWHQASPARNKPMGTCQTLPESPQGHYGPDLRHSNDRLTLTWEDYSSKKQQVVWLNNSDTCFRD